MKIKIEKHNEDEVIIHYQTLTPTILQLQKIIHDFFNHEKTILVSDKKGEKVILLSDILYFETDQNKVYAHLATHYFLCKQKLFELEAILPTYFIRVSKSAIVNIKKIEYYRKTISQNLLLQFFTSQKVLYVSRKYTKILKEQLLERNLK